MPADALEFVDVNFVSALSGKRCDAGSQLQPSTAMYPLKCLMRRSRIPCHVSTYVRRLESAGVSSTAGAPTALSHRILKPVRSELPIADGVCRTSHTQRSGSSDGTKRSDGVKSTTVRPLERRTSACTLIGDWSGVHG